MKCRCFFASLLFGCVFISPQLWAQAATPLSTQETELIAVNTSEAIPVGPFIFSPALQLKWQLRDNIFFTPDNEVSDQLYLARLRLLFELPIYESYVRFSYTPQYRDFRTYQLQDKWSHFVNASAAFQFSNGLILNADYNFIIGNLETREVDPGGELVFGDPQFEKHSVSVDGDYWITARDGVRFDISWTDVDHSDPRLFYDYTMLGGGIGWVHQVSPILVMDLSYDAIKHDAHDSPFQSNDFRDSTSNGLTLGLRGMINPVVATGFRIGYRVTEYNRQPGDPPIEDFTGFIASGFIGWDLAHGSNIRLDLLRMPYPSNFADNAHYVATGASLMYSIERANILGQARVRYQNNDYQLPDPDSGEFRSDDIYTLGLGLGVRVTKLFSLYGTYLYEDRRTIYEYSYTANVFSLGLVLGF